MISLAALSAWNRHAFLLDDLTQKHTCTYLCVDKQFFIGPISSFFIKWKPDDETPVDCCPQTACSRWRRHEIFEYFRTQGQCVSSRPGCWPMNTIWRHSTPSVRMQVDARGDSLLIDWGLKSFWKKEASLETKQWQNEQVRFHFRCSSFYHAGGNSLLLIRCPILPKFESKFL